MSCARHPDTDARWECVRCQALHCEACIRRLGPRGTFLACAHCDGVLRAVEVRVVAPAGVALPALLNRLRDRQALAMVGVVGGSSALAALPLPIIDLALTTLALLTAAATYVQVVQHVARGKAGFPAPVESDATGWTPFVQRGMLGLLVLATPLGLWRASDRGAESLAELASRHPVTAALLALLSSAWLAAALGTMLASDAALPAFWPPALFRIVARAPALFVRVTLLLAVGAAALVVTHQLGSQLFHLLPAPTALAAGATASLAALVAFAHALLVGALFERQSGLL